MRRHRGFRLWAAVGWAVFQLTLSTALLYADAGLERQSGTVRGTHVEASSRSTCRPVHSAACVLCQCVSDFSAPSQRAGSDPVVGPIREPEDTPQRIPPTRRFAGVAPARAPPRA